ncbi:MAG TPA: class I SAM-dependent methyltransferase [Gaiellaceae bacterium]
MSPEASLADLQGPAGNTYDKYGTRNPVARLVVGRFLRAAEAAVEDAGGSSILDVGCGEGLLTERIAGLRPGADVVGLDVDDPRLGAEWKQRRGDNLSFRAGSAYSLPFKDAAFELVCGFEVLEHLERPAEALTELARVASRHLVVSVPREPLWRVLNILSLRYLPALGNTPGHVNHWSRAGFVTFVQTAGDVTRVRTPPPWTIVTVRR